nr:hypothetical protein [Melioribacteraceae bacterium]
MKNFTLIFVYLIFAVGLTFGQSEKINSKLILKLTTLESKTEKVWIFFTDKGGYTEKYYSNPLLVVSKKSLDRRNKLKTFDKGIDYIDLPVNEQYINEIKSLGVTVIQKSKWFNGISCNADISIINKISKYDFVKKIELVEKYKSINLVDESSEGFEINQMQPKGVNTYNYGSSYTQLQQINVPAVHNLGYKGQGVVVGVLDAGFNNLPHEVFNSMDIMAAYDFVNNDPDVGDGTGMGEGSHGTQTLSTIGGFKDGKLIGPAFASTYILAKTENTESETPVEEDN